MKTKLGVVECLLCQQHNKLCNTTTCARMHTRPHTHIVRCQHCRFVTLCQHNKTESLCIMSHKTRCSSAWLSPVFYTCAEKLVISWTINFVKLKVPSKVGGQLDLQLCKVEGPITWTFNFVKLVVSWTLNFVKFVVPLNSWWSTY